jgi:hypothetical protein
LTLSRFCIETSEAFGIDRLDHEVVGAGAHRLDRGLDRALRRLHDDRAFGAHRGQPLEELQPVHARHHEVEHDEIDRLPARARQERQPRLAAVDGEGIEAEALGHFFQDAALGRIVVDDEDAWGHGRWFRCEGPRTLPHNGKEALKPWPLWHRAGLDPQAAIAPAYCAALPQRPPLEPGVPFAHMTCYGPSARKPSRPGIQP